MQLAAHTGLSKTKQRELAVLLLASLACVLALAAGIVSGGDVIPLNKLPLAALLGGAALLALAAIWLRADNAKREVKIAQAEAKQFKRNLAAADSIIRSEPQILMFWEQNKPLRIVAQTLKGIPGLPEQKHHFLRFGQWLEPRSTGTLKHSLDHLFASGQPFNVILRTQAGGHIEAEGRTAGGRAILRLRNVTGHREQVARILSQHQHLAREIRSSRALLDTLPMPVWLRANDGRLLWVNNAYIKAVEAQTRMEVQERQIELLEQRQRKAITHALAHGDGYRGRMPLTIGGERKPHDVVVFPFEDATAAAAIDVTAIEKAQGDLERQIAAYDRTLDRVATAVAIFNRDQQLVFFNRAYTNLWDLDEGWLRTRPSDASILDRLREKGRLPEVVNYPEWKAGILSCYSKTKENEDWWHLPDGRMLHVMAEQRSDGGVTYLFANETERLALESEYNAFINVQRETLDSLKEGVAVFATDGRLKLYNTAFAEIWQLSRHALGQGPHIDAVIDESRALFDEPKDWAQIKRAVTAISEERETIEGQMVRPDGMIIDYAAMPLPDGATLFTVVDVTDSKRYERALEERNEALVTADRMKNEFIGHISYELRTPLTNIIGFTDLLHSPHVGPLNEKQREYLGDISASSKTLLAIIDDILALATMDAGAMELNLGRVDVRNVLDAAAVSIRKDILRSQLTLHIAVADDIESFTADEARVRQMLFNLLSNAVGFSKPGGVVNVTCLRENQMVVFTVEDQGMGIPKEQQWRVFERFESKPRGSRHRGAGLGLSIVKSLVELHGGTISLESEPGQGTTVTVRLPEHGQPQADGGDTSPQSGPNSGLSTGGHAA